MRTNNNEDVRAVRADGVVNRKPITCVMRVAVGTRTARPPAARAGRRTGNFRFAFGVLRFSPFSLVVAREISDILIVRVEDYVIDSLDSGLRCIYCIARRPRRPLATGARRTGRPRRRATATRDGDATHRPDARGLHLHLSKRDHPVHRDRLTSNGTGGSVLPPHGEAPRVVCSSCAHQQISHACACTTKHSTIR